MDPGLGASVGGLVALATAAALVPLRGSLATSSVALVLVLPVLLGAGIGGWQGGASAALVAALGFDFFFTRPYRSLKIESSNDLQTAAILLTVGLIVGAVASRARITSMTAADGRTEIRRVHRVAELAASETTPQSIVDVALVELAQMLHVSECIVERRRDEPDSSSLPELGRHGGIGLLSHRYVKHSFGLPESGFQIAASSGGRQWGRIVVRGIDPHHGVSTEQGMVAIILADHVGAALAAEHLNGKDTTR